MANLNDSFTTGQAKAMVYEIMRTLQAINQRLESIHMLLASARGVVSNPVIPPPCDYYTPPPVYPVFVPTHTPPDTTICKAPNSPSEPLWCDCDICLARDNSPESK